MQKSETVFRKKVRAVLEKIPNSWWESIQQKTIRGTPDIIGCVNGRFVAIELKSEKGVLAPLQEYKLNGIIKANGIAFSVRPSEWDKISKEISKISLG